MSEYNENEDFDSEDQENEEVVEEVIRAVESEKRSRGTLLDLIDSQIYFIQQLQNITGDIFEIQVAKCGNQCFEVIGKAQEKILEKIKEM